MVANKGKSQKKPPPAGVNIEIGGNLDTGGGDIAAGSISKRNVIIYRGSKKKISQVNNLFQPIYDKIDHTSDILPQDREILRKNVQEIQREVSNGKNASGRTLEKLIQRIVPISHDVFELVVAILAHPKIGLSIVAKKVTRKVFQAREEDIKKNE